MTSFKLQIENLLENLIGRVVEFGMVLCLDPQICHIIRLLGPKSLVKNKYCE